MYLIQFAWPPRKYKGSALSSAYKLKYMLSA